MAKTTTSKASGGGAVAKAFKEIAAAFGGGGGDVRRAEDRAASQPSYSAFSVKGLTSSDPANVARNQAAAAMYASQPSMIGGGDRKAAEAPAAAGAVAMGQQAPAAVAQPLMPAPPPTPLPVISGDMTSTGSAEDAALESAKKGRAATIATSAQGLLAEGVDQLRRRRSIMGGGLIQ